MTSGLALLAVASIAMAAPPAPPTGLDVNGTELRLVGNDSWRVRLGPSATVGAREVELIAKATAGAQGAYDRQDKAYIWAPRCATGRQVLTFEKKLFLPGPAKRWFAEFYDTTTSGAGDQAISRVRIAVNGKIIHSAATARFSINERFTPLFTHGTNTIQIFVEKRAQQGPALGRCFNGNPARPLGISFVLYADFEADLFVSRDRDTPDVRYIRVRNEVGAQTFVTVAPLNLGPSGAYTGELVTDVTGSGLRGSAILGDVTVSGKGLSNCRVLQRKTITCAINQFGKGDKPRIAFKVGHLFTLPVTQASSVISTQIYSPTRDPQFRNGGKQSIVYFCGETATDPKCPP